MFFSLRLVRHCNKDLQTDDLFIHAGTNIIVPVYHMHHDPLYFPDPDTFDPERWLADNDDRLTD